MWNDLGTALVQTRQLDITREAEQGLLARIATACRHSRVREQLASVNHWLRAGQLGDGYVDRPACPVTARCTA